MKESELRHQEVFRGRWARPLAWAWFALAAVVAVDAARRGDAGDIAVIYAGLAAVTVVVYALAYRPAVVVDDAGVLLRNVVRDVYVPWPAVEDVDRSWVLAIEAQGRRYVAWAVSARNDARQGRAAAVEASLMPRGSAHSDPPDDASGRVLDRWARWRDQVPSGPVTVTYLWPVAGALAASLLALAVALLVAD